MNGISNGFWWRIVLIISLINVSISEDVILNSSSLSNTEQYIIIGCVAGFTFTILIIFVIACLVKCHSRDNGLRKDLGTDYKSLDNFISAEDYPASLCSGDRKLATSAQMYHYQLSKQQIIDLEHAEAQKQGASNDQEGESDSNEESTVYECQGMGKIQNLEIHNPLFDGTEVTTGSDVNNNTVVSPIGKK